MKTLSANWKCFLFNSTLLIEKGNDVLFYIILYNFISLNFIAYLEVVVYDTISVFFRDFVKNFHTIITVHKWINIILNFHILLHIIPFLLCHINGCLLLTYLTLYWYSRDCQRIELTNLKKTLIRLNISVSGVIFHNTVWCMQ